MLAALNPEVFFGYFSVCADGGGHGSNTTFPGLDWGQSAEALLWLGRRPEVLASWEYVKGFQQADGRLPFAVIPDLANRTVTVEGKYILEAEDAGAVFVHWVPGNPLQTLANVTFLLLADAIYSDTGDATWLAQQLPWLDRAAHWLRARIDQKGLMPGGGFYLERPTRLGYDGVSQCYGVHALRQAAGLLEAAGHGEAAVECRTSADQLATAFVNHFWTQDHFAESLHPTRGFTHHGLTDVDWAAVATGVATQDQVDILWPQLRDQPAFLYTDRGTGLPIPTGISTLPETYQDWEMQHIDRHDLAAMGRVWYLECWARARLGDQVGLRHSLDLVAAVGRANGWSWRERYYAASTGDQAKAQIDHYCEYPANFIRIVHRFLLADPERVCHQR